MSELHNAEDVELIGNMLLAGRLPERLQPVYDAIITDESVLSAWQGYIVTLRTSIEKTDKPLGKKDRYRKILLAIQRLKEFNETFFAIAESVGIHDEQADDGTVLHCAYTYNKFCETPEDCSLLQFHIQLLGVEPTGKTIDDSDEPSRN